MKKVPFHTSALRSTLKGGLIGSATALPLMMVALPAAAQNNAQLEQMQQQIDQLQQQVTAMGAEQAKESKPANGFNVGDTNIKVGGYVKLQAFYYLGQDLGSSAVTGNINTTGDNEDGHARFQSYQTRLTIDSSTPSSWGTVKGHIEGDFYGGTSRDSHSQSSGLRLRQAFVTWNGWLLGQAWSTFTDGHYGDNIDFNGPEGQTFTRHAQIRYTADLSPSSQLAFAIEDPTTSGDGTAALDSDGDLQSANAQHQMPDFVVRYDFNQGPLSFRAAAMYRSLKYTGGLITGDNKVNGYAGLLAGSYELPTGTTLMATVNGGKGYSNYVYTPDVSDVYVDTDGDLKATKNWGGTATISQALTSQLTANLVYGFDKTEDLSDRQATAAYSGSKEGKLYQNVHANLIYKPVHNLALGVEYIYSHKKDQAGEHGSANSLVFGTKLSF